MYYFTGVAITFMRIQIHDGLNRCAGFIYSELSKQNTAKKKMSHCKIKGGPGIL